MAPLAPDQVPTAAAAQASSSGGASPIAARVRTSTTAPRRGADAVTAGRETATAIPAAPARMAASQIRWLTAGPPRRYLAGRLAARRTARRAARDPARRSPGGPAPPAGRRPLPAAAR